MLHATSPCFSFLFLATSTVAPPRTHANADFDDLVALQTVNLVSERFPSAPLVAVGVSLGSMILTKYLGEEGSNTPLSGAMSISNPWDLHHATDSLEAFPSKQLYNSRLAAKLRHLVHNNKDVLDELVDFEALGSAKTIKEFDALVIVQMFGYADVEAYYADATSLKWAPHVAIPLLCLNAADDPFSPLTGIPVDMCQQNSNVVVAVPPCGGHVGFPLGPLGPFGPSLMDLAFAEFAMAVAKLPKKQQ
eukprot:m.254325 g.254325  ORF g.254325 m.254325 type:complete len:248 (+) comp19144_c0_seq3:89-832(+)